MASLQARHQRSCKLARPWTTFAAATKAHGGTCVPLYHLVHRHGGKLIREPVGQNRKEAARALDARRGDIARRRFRVVKDITFADWGDQWLESFTGKASSRRVYAHTIEYGKRTFGKVKVRDLDPSDVERFFTTIRRAARERRPAKTR
jgi:hypothetical protein